MKVLIIGDLHFGIRNNSPIFLNMMDTYFKEELFPLIEEHNIQNVIMLGDLLDKRKNVEFTISSYIKSQFFPYFRKNSINFYSILGNHDIYFRKSFEINGPSQLIDIEDRYIKIITKPTCLKLDGKRFHLIPWICEENKEEILNYLLQNKSSKDIVLGHFELEGFKLQGRIFSDKGTIDNNILSDNYRCTISGHYHSNSQKGNIMYLGTPYQLTWNDYGDEKQVCIYDTEQDKFLVYRTKKQMFHKILFHDEIMRNFNYDSVKDCALKIIINNNIREARLNNFLASLSEKSHPFSIQVINTDTIDSNKKEDIQLENIENPIEIMIDLLKTKLDNETFIIAKKMALDAYKIAQDVIV